MAMLIGNTLPGEKIREEDQCLSDTDKAIHFSAYSFGFGFKLFVHRLPPPATPVKLVTSHSVDRS
jgi:hypothetical protein